jgi:hypothetical protein
MNDVRDSRRKHLDELDKGDGMKEMIERLAQMKRLVGDMEWIVDRHPEPVKFMSKAFEIGKYYKHAGGGYLHILGVIRTTMWGICFVAEEGGCGCGHILKPVGMDSSCSQNWTETTQEDWASLFNEEMK